MRPLAASACGRGIQRGSRIRGSGFRARFVAALGIAACVAVLTTVSAPAGAASLADWRADMAALLKDIRAVHPDPFTKTGELTFMRRYADFMSALPGLTEEQRVVGAMKLVALVGDGHTQLEPNDPAFAYWYPVRIYEFTDGYFITSAFKDVRELAGAQLLKVAGRPAPEVIGRARELSSADNGFGLMEYLAPLHSAALMKGLGYAQANGDLEVEVKLASGKVATRKLTPRKTNDARYAPDDSSFDWRFAAETIGPPLGTPDDWISAYKELPASAFRTPGPTRPPHLMLRRALYAQALPAQDAYYIMANVVNDSADETFEGFFARAMRAVEAQKPRRLIIDLRYNVGGDGSRVPALIHSFIQRANDPPWRELYLLTGRKTFSAGIMMAQGFMDNVDVSVVGEPMGAALNSYGDATEILYERVHLRLHVSTVYHLSDGFNLREYSPVDLPAPFSFSDWSAGRDPAVDPILRGDEMRSLVAIALADGGAAARRAQEERAQRYARYDWWAPPPEIVLRRATQRLVEDGRVADAVETAMLSTELHPDIWNTWYNLALAQTAAGAKTGAQASYWRLLEVDPDNINRDEIANAIAEDTSGGAFALPASISFGAGVAAAQTGLGQSCRPQRLRRIDPPFLDDVKREQMQIDCEAFVFQGAPRHAEFVFRDDALVMVWIMTTPAEDASLEQAMTGAYGAPTLRNSTYVVYGAQRAALRLDKHEVLFYSQALDAEAGSWFAE